MTKQTYETVKRDCLTLCDIDSNADFAEVDAGVWGLMAEPTKTAAKSMYLSAIGLWFASVGCRASAMDTCVSERVLLNEEVVRIAEKYGYL